MKKVIMGLATLAMALSVNAQNNPQIQNKKGVDLIPRQGDFAIGINAVPVLNFVGDLFGYVDNNNALGGNKFVSSFAGNTLFGKYMLTDNTAIRGHLRISMDNNTYRNEVDDNGQDDDAFMVTDEYKSRRAIYNIGAGYEWRRGKTRLRGIYGGEVFYQFMQGAKREYTYGNPFQEGNDAPTATQWGTNGFIEAVFANSERVVSVEGGNYNGVGLRAFAGVEYFVAPKICLGTEFGWGGSYGMVSDRTTKFESWNNTDDVLESREVTSAGGSSFNLDTDNFNGALYFMFYF